jgi:arylsulfatase A-like enzyme
MIEAMDFHIGRLIEFLKQRGQYDNTIFIFTSDNGSEASGPANPQAFPKRLVPESLGYNLDYDNLGLKGSYSTIGPSFASASASPLAYYKFYAGEGGMRVPLIIAGKPVVAQAQLTRAFAWATDISPTILSLTGVSQPEERYAGRPVQTITGRDLTPLLSGSAERVYDPDDTVGYELTDHGVLFQGDYKLVINQPPRGDGQWRLFNIVTDPGETADLSGSQALRFQRMLSGYEQYSRDNKVVPVPPGYNQIKQVFFNILLKYKNTTLVVLLTLLLLLPFYVAYLMKNRMNRKSKL